MGWEEDVILLVEDNDNDRFLMFRALQATSVSERDVVVVRDGAEVLDYIHAVGRHAGRDQRVLPSLILLDLKIPKISGLEVLRSIRSDRRLRFVPVVVLTTSTQEEDLLAAYEGGCNSYIYKAVDFTKFVESVVAIVSYWLHLNTLAPSPQP